MTFLPFRVQASALNRSFNLINEAQKRFNDEGGFPPYDIVRKDDSTYTIRLAVAGFSEEELNITAKQNLLTVSGQKKAEEQRQYLYEGISAQNFERQFSLADHVEVRGAGYKHGILEIELRQESSRGSQAAKNSNKRRRIGQAHQLRVRLCEGLYRHGNFRAR